MLEIRKTQQEDIICLVDVIRNVWRMDVFSGGMRTGRYMSQEYLMDVLSRSTGVFTAWLDGKVVGFIALREQEKAAVQFSPCTITGSLNYESIRRMQSRMKEYDSMCEALLRESGEYFDGEVTLLAVASSVQGKGVGSALFQKAKEIFSNKRFFLYTDTGCNYQFYDTHGMKCLAVKNDENPVHKKRSFRIFLYGNY